MFCSSFSMHAKKKINQLIFFTTKFYARYCIYTQFTRYKLMLNKRWDRSEKLSDFMILLILSLKIIPKLSKTAIGFNQNDSQTIHKTDGPMNQNKLARWRFHIIMGSHGWRNARTDLGRAGLTIGQTGQMPKASRFWGPRA